MVAATTRSRRAWLASGVLLGVSLLVPSFAQAQQIAPATAPGTAAEEETLRRREQGARLVGDALSAWPASYPYFRARPPLAGGPLQRPYPWEVLGSPYVAVLPSREIHFMGVEPSQIDRCYGLLERNDVTPLLFRSNLSEARPYLAAG